MIELPEARTIASDLRKSILGKKIIDVSGNFIDHKFTFYYKDPNRYKEQLTGQCIIKINDRNYYVEAETERYKILFRDGANMRYFDNASALPTKSKLMLQFEDDSLLNVTTSMYAFIAVFEKAYDMDDIYYQEELNGVGALDEAFTLPYFINLVDEKTIKLSVKTFLATRQRILGIGNGTVQDIVFNAGLNPKRKIDSLSDAEIKNLFSSVVYTLNEMTENGGRDTEIGINGRRGGYKTKMSSITYKKGCPVCGGEIEKEQYLGGSIYYCSACQK